MYFQLARTNIRKHLDDYRSGRSTPSSSVHSVADIAPNQLITEQPSTGLLSTDLPYTDLLSTDQPSTGLLSTDQPSSGLLSTDQPSMAQSTSGQLSTHQPSTGQLSPDQHSMDQLSTDLPSTSQICATQSSPGFPQYDEACAGARTLSVSLLATLPGPTRIRNQKVGVTRLIASDQLRLFLLY